MDNPKGNLGLVGYSPHQVARQFGLSQFRPTFLYRKSKDICNGYFAMTVASFHQHLQDSTEQASNFVPIPFQVSFLGTEAFNLGLKESCDFNFPSTCRNS